MEAWNSMNYWYKLASRLPPSALNKLSRNTKPLSYLFQLWGGLDAAIYQHHDKWPRSRRQLISSRNENDIRFRFLNFVEQHSLQLGQQIHCTEYAPSLHLVTKPTNEMLQTSKWPWTTWRQSFSVTCLRSLSLLVVHKAKKRVK